MTVRRWLPEAILIVSVVALGLSEASYAWWDVQSRSLYSTFTVLVAACAAAMCRRLPGAALGLAWLSGALLVTTSSTVLTMGHCVAWMAVSFGCARFGSRTVVGLAGLSIPASLLAAFVTVPGRGIEVLPWAAWDVLTALQGVLDSRQTELMALIVLGILAMLTPWLIGLALRARARQSEAEAERDVVAGEARALAEVARLRADQARLARDVHDVVGHSLAVILAQAESAQFIPDERLPAIRQTLDNVATAARR